MLTENEKEYWRTLQTEYTHDRKKYERQEEALQEIREKIQESINRTFLRYTFNCETPYEMMVKLKQKFAPTDRARELDLVDD